MTARDPERLAALALGDLPPAEADELRPHGGETLATIELVIAALQAEGQHTPTLPQNLAATTLARLPHTTPGRLAWSGRRILSDNLQTITSIAAGLFLTVTLTGLFATAISKVRAESQLLACRNTLRELHFALDGYAETHATRYPEVGTPGLPMAGDLGTELGRAGQLPTAASCPLGEPYAYSLGYHSNNGRVFGLRRGDTDLNPIAADARQMAHGGGRNVLFTGGAVRYTTTTTVGFNGDEIFANQLGERRAGLSRIDASLGGADDSP